VENYDGEKEEAGELEAEIENGIDVYEKKKRKLTLTLNRSSFSKEKHELYSLYNTTVHKKDPPTEESFTRFLCTQSIAYEEELSPDAPEDPEGKESKYKYDGTEHHPWQLKLGTHHLEFRLDGKLIGVLVQNYMRTGLCSMYFFYNPVFKPLSFGVVSALIELEILAERQAYFPEHQYYYLMTYIYGNKPLAYKVNYKPMEIYCDETRNWVPHNEEVIERLKNDEVKLAPEGTKTNYDDDFCDDLLGYLAGITGTTNLITTREELTGKMPPRRPFDLNEIDYCTVSFDLARDSKSRLGWWWRKAIHMYQIFSDCGVTLTSNVYWDLANIYTP
jgi:arginyl-tRNA--protein-N-Asp/Glu arginylyltransferase